MKKLLLFLIPLIVTLKCYSAGDTTKFNGGVTLPASAIVATGTPLGTTFLNGLGAWAVPAGSGGGGTVTSIATSTGILGGTITTSGTLKADTTVLQTVLNFFPKGDTRYAKISATPTGANPTASIGFTAVNGSATTYTRSDGAPKADSTIIASAANHPTLAQQQTKFNGETLQVVAARGNSYNAQIQAQTFAATGTGGNGYIDILSQSASPTSTTNHIKLYSDSLNRLSWKNSLYRRTIRVPYPSDYTINMPYQATSTVLVDSTYAATHYAPIGVTGSVTSITPGYGFTSATPITVSGTMTIDTASKIRSFLNSYSKAQTNTQISNAIAAISPYTAGYSINIASNVVKVDTSGAHNAASKDYLQAYTYTKAQSDAAYATIANLALKAPIASPTFTAKAITPELDISGTGGAGFIDLIAQSSPPSTPATNHQIIYADASGRFSIMGSNGFSASLTKTLLTASRVYTLPDSAGIVQLENRIQPVAYGGTGVTTSTGTGSTVLSTSPTLVTPVLGTPTSMTATNVTGLPLTTGVTGLLPQSNQLNGGSNDFYALQLLGSAAKGYEPGAPVYVANSTLTMLSGTVYWVAVYLPVGATLTGVNMFMNTSGAYTSTGFNGVALYTLSSGTLTQVAVSTTSATVWKASPGMNQVPFSSTYVATAGIYYVAFVWQSSATTTSPLVYAQNEAGTVGASYGFTNSVKLQGTSSNTVLPSTQAMSGVSTASNLPFLQLY